MQHWKNPCICEEYYRGSDCRLSFSNQLIKKIMHIFALLYVKCIAYKLTLLHYRIQAGGLGFDTMQMEQLNKRRQNTCVFKKIII